MVVSFENLKESSVQIHRVEQLAEIFGEKLKIETSESGDFILVIGKVRWFVRAYIDVSKEDFYNFSMYLAATYPEKSLTPNSR